MVGTEWSDAAWEMTEQVKRSFSEDVERFVKAGEAENVLALGIHYKFRR